MHTIIYLLVGVVLGVPLGWALLFLLVMSDAIPDRPPTKDEWNVM